MNLNVVSKIDIEYADTSYFHDEIQSEVNSFIIQLAKECNTDNIGVIDYDDVVDDAETLTVGKRIWMRMLDRLAQRDPNEVCISNDDIEFTAEELYGIFRDIYNRASKGYDVIQLEWF